MEQNQEPESESSQRQKFAASIQQSSEVDMQLLEERLSTIEASLREKSMSRRVATGLLRDDLELLQRSKAEALRHLDKENFKDHLALLDRAIEAIFSLADNFGISLDKSASHFRESEKNKSHGR